MSQTKQSQSVCIECANCHHVYHVKCINANREDIISNALWYCIHCLQIILPLNLIEDSQEFYSVIMECVSDHPYQFHETNDNDFISFEINESTDTPYTKMDPDIQFYSSTHNALNTRCYHFIEDTLFTNIAGKNQYKNKLSLFHIYVKSLPKHHDELGLYINSLKFKFSVKALTLNWLGESKQDIFDPQGSNCLHKFCKGKT